MQCNEIFVRLAPQFVVEARASYAWTGKARSAVVIALAVASSILVTSCGRSADRTASGAQANTSGGSAVRTSTPSAKKRPVVLFVGTSLTAGFGLDDPPAQAFPVVVGRLADSAGLPIRVINAGVSGETSAGALQRVSWLLRDSANIVVIETGANDGLRGISVAAARANIQSIVRQFKAAWPSAPIFLVQMEAPPNLGRKYVMAFHGMYAEIARQEGVTLTPFLLDGVAGQRAFNQSDGLHPNAQGAEKVGHMVWSVLEPAVRGYYL